MATVRKPSSLAARKMRMAISLRLAASSLRIGLVFFISEAIKVSREILHCFMQRTRPGRSSFDLEEQFFFCVERGVLGASLAYGVADAWSMMGPAELAEPGVDATDFNCCSWVWTFVHALALRFVAYGASGSAKKCSSSDLTSGAAPANLFSASLSSNSAWASSFKRYFPGPVFWPTSKLLLGKLSRPSRTSVKSSR